MDAGALLGAVDGLAIAAKWLRSHGFTDRQLTVMFRENPARLMGLPPQ